MAKTEEQKVARRARREMARREREEAVRKYEALVRDRAGPGPYEHVFCYKCHEQGHYAARCRVKRRKEGRNEKNRRIRFEIVCFKCKKEGHFFSHCPEDKEKKKKKESLPSSGSTEGVILCYHCKRRGHTARNCSERQQRRRSVSCLPRAAAKFVKSDGSIVYFCKKCKNWGHMDTECTGPVEAPPGKTDMEASF